MSTPEPVASRQAPRGGPDNSGATLRFLETTNPAEPGSAPRLAGPHLLSFAAGRPALMGSHCTRCGEFYFPATTGCTRCCTSQLEDCNLGSAGRLWSWTIQGFCPKPPYDSGEPDAAFKPYGVGYVEMASGLKVEARLTTADPAQLRIGMPMALTLVPCRQVAGGEPVYTFAFEPATEHAA